MFGDEVYVHHLERQVDLPIEVIRQYLYDPDFEARVEKIFGKSQSPLTGQFNFYSTVKEV